MSKVWIGIDPGISGGVGIIFDKMFLLDIKKTFNLTNPVCLAYNCPKTIKDMSDLLSPYKENVSAVIEKVHSMPGQGVASTFKFGKNYGMWLGILAALKISYLEVSPQKWQKHFGAMPKDKKERKNHLKHLAQQRFPDVEVTLKTADAILLAVYGKELNDGMDR